MTSTDRRRGRASSRDRLIAAALEQITLNGLQTLTLDAVAAAAGVTKGGLIYHFKTRDDLLLAVVENIVEGLDVQARTAQDTADGKSPLQRALMLLMDDTFNMPETQRHLLTNCLAAVSTHQHLIGPVQALYARSYDHLLRSSTDPGRALTLAVAMDGLLLLELMNLHTFSPEQRQSIREAIEREIRSLS